MTRLPRSERHAPKGERLGEPDAGAPIHLTVLLRPGTKLDPAALGTGHCLSRAEYARRHATDRAIVDRLCAHATSHGLRVVSADPVTHVVRLEGTIAEARAAFAPDGLATYRIGGNTVRARHGHLHAPADLAPYITVITGFDARPVARAHFRFRPAATAGTSYSPADVARRYGFPTDVTGQGQTIALIELGGGYDAQQIADWFAAAGIDRTGTLSAVAVDGAGNAPEGDPNSADGEVQLDIEVAGAAAPGADLAVYFAPNTSAGFLDAILAAVHDTARSPSVLSISWGGPESSWSAQDLDGMDQAFATAATLGITVCAASGDSGATDGSADGSLAADFPASSPNALGCGGTSLPASGSETVWNDGAGGGATGGGYSTHFPRPSWQAIDGQARGVPDVAGDADPATGYAVSIDGQDGVIGGTSAVAPLWAALIALANQRAGRRAGLVQPALYARPDAFTDITQGDNNGYEAAPGWDPCTGLGSPLGETVVAVLAAAGGTQAADDGTTADVG